MHDVGSRWNHDVVELSQGRCRTDRAYVSSRLLKILVVGMIGVSGVCQTIQVIKRSAAHHKSDAAAVIVDDDAGKMRSVWLDHGREEFPEADWLIVSLVAPSFYSPPLEESSSWMFRFLSHVAGFSWKSSRRWLVPRRQGRFFRCGMQ